MAVIKYDSTILNMIDLPDLRPDGFGITINEFSEAKHCSKEMAAMLLRKAVNEGILECKRMRTSKTAKSYVFYKTGTLDK